MVKAGLLEPQSPCGGSAHPSVARLYADAIRTTPFSFRGVYTLPDGDRAMSPGKGMSGEPTSLSTRSAVTEHEIAYGARAPRRRSSRSSRGGNVPPGRAGEPLTGRRGTGDPMESVGRCA